MLEVLYFQLVKVDLKVKTRLFSHQYRVYFCFILSLVSVSKKKFAYFVIHDNVYFNLSCL